MITYFGNSFLRGIISICIIVSLTGCANDYQRTQTGGAVVGGAVGAVVGGAVGVGAGLLIGVLSHDSRAGANTAIALGTAGALAGAAIGGMQGYKWGTAVARKKQEYANSEDYLNACIADTQSLRKTAESANASLKVTIQKLNAQTDALLAKGKPTKAQTAGLQKRIVANQNLAEDGIKRINEEIAIQQHAVSSTEGISSAKLARAKLEEEVAALRLQKKQLALHNDQLEQTSGRLGV